MTSFTAAYPSYESTAILDELRAREYARLDRTGHAYLDYTAGNLYALSQVERHLALLREHVFGNPHSTNPTSSLTMDFIGQARARCSDFFNASPDEWVVIFTANASQALKLVGESYPFDSGRPVPADVRQPQLGERHPRVRARQGSDGHVRARAPAGDACG